MVSQETYVSIALKDESAERLADRAPLFLLSLLFTDNAEGGDGTGAQPTETNPGFTLFTLASPLNSHATC